ncbi:MAG: DinB family protein [Anaerolineae bacterium]|nr:DinB family protein [Anaerolineae bacterium]
MLNHALNDCPDELWRARLWDNPTREKFFLPEYWYIVYHTLFWLDLYLTGAEEGFVPPPPFTLIEQDEDGPLPERAYTKEELLAYLAECREKCQATILALTDEAAQQRCQFAWGEVSFAELLLYNMRHVQEHEAQLSLFLGQRVGIELDWEAIARRNAV